MRSAPDPEPTVRVYDGTSDLAGRIAVVTGASSGIGRATAELLAARGALVTAVARSRDLLKEVAATNPTAIHAHAADVTDPAAVDALFTDVEQRFGSCSIVVNSAGVLEPRLLVEMTLKEWELHFSANVTSIFLTSKRAVPGMMTAGGGAIVNVASISGVAGPQKFPGFSAYCASKAAVIALTECMAVELGLHGIRVNAVSPGSVDTPMLRKAGLDPDMTAGEVAETILFLASNRSRPINGQNLHVFSS
jgi:NAD(P)-dependent dehydrogenase (short-subunit alcohol dehydrogenase family)